MINTPFFPRGQVTAVHRHVTLEAIPDDLLPVHRVIA
jgi:hypothetical protein